LKRKRSETTIVALTGIVITWALFRFNQNANSYYYYLIGNLIGLFFVPILIITLLFRDEPRDYGFGYSDSGRAWWIVAILFAVTLPALLILSHRHGYQSYYPFFRHFNDMPGTLAEASKWRVFLFAEAAFGLYLLCWEFFFRGYLLFGLMSSFGWWAVILQAIPFGIMHFGKPEFVMSFFGGIILGAVAARARSILPAFVLHFAVSLTLDLLILRSRIG
jgi:uncharacterized protein